MCFLTPFSEVLGTSNSVGQSKAKLPVALVAKDKFSVQSPYGA